VCGIASVSMKGSAMIDISVKDLVKSFEVGTNILDGLSFDVDAGERVGILGHNGCGKTTLFRILVGEIDYDTGSFAIAPGKRIGLISQIPRYPAGHTVEDVLKTAHARLYAMAERMTELTRQMETDSSPAVLREYDRLQADYQRLGGYEMDVERNRVANGLDIPAPMRVQSFDSLSGGEKTRVNLARLILEDTDILLLDEPTNHLDLHATEWLEDYLLKFKGTVLAISHDRYFLDRVAQRTIELVNGRAEFYSGNYSFYVVEKQRRFEEKLKQYEKDQAKLKQLQEAADKLHLWAFMGNDKLHKRAFSMEKRMAKLEQTERPKTERKLNLRFGQREFHGDEVVLLDGVSKSFGGKTLFHDLDLLIEGEDRIALIGDNGTGKSTLLKLIMDEELPDAGFIRRGPAVKTAYLPQIIRFQDPSRSVLDTVMYEENCTHQAARNRLGAFRFSGEDVFKPVATLSGGEQSRLRLCMLMREEINFLILDEPTNHLDILSREWIEEAVEDYEGALLFVSHDRYFIDRFATRIWELEGGTITDFRGGFTEFRAWKERQAALKQQPAFKNDTKKRDNPKKAQPRPEKRLAKLERDIEKLETQLRELEDDAEANATDYQRLMEIEVQRTALEQQLEGLYLEWEELSS
jgi:ATP-binding cassette subfamily F protein 3